MPLEEMSSFFDARVDNYDTHMLNEVEGCREGYEKLASLLPPQAADLLDLGCGTGLELDKIFRVNPDICVTGVDLSGAMLAKLSQKYRGRNLTLIRGNYLDCDFGACRFDAAVSFESLHHLTLAEKLKLYAKVLFALRPGGLYIEGDYVAADLPQEDFLRRECERLRREEGIPEGVLCHFDMPCTVGHQLALLRAAGFVRAQHVWQTGNTAILTAEAP